jgi:hypothetical protein
MTGKTFAPFAMQLHSMERDVEKHRTAIDLCRGAGIKLIRDEIHWGRVEREKGVLKIDDLVVQNVEYTVSTGIEPMIILDYGNGFYDDGNAPVSPEAVEGFARYCEFMARTFKDQIRYWEVWNEPNWEGFWKPKPDPVDYTNLLKASYAACKRANPDCTVIGVATSGIPMDFIEGVLKAGGAAYMDALSVHPYRYPASPEAHDLVADLTKLRELMDRYGAQDLPIWITEIGWPTHKGASGSTPDRQADILVRAYVESMAAGVETIFWYWLGSDGPDQTYNEDNFGLLFRDGSPKPAYFALQTMSRCLEGARYTRSISIADNTRMRIFTDGDTETAVLWCTDGVRTLSFRTDEDVTVTSPSVRHTLSPVNGVITLTLTETPRYLVSRTPLHESDVLIDSPFEFEPARASAAAGEHAPIGIRAKNMGTDDINVRVRLLSDATSPDDHRAPLVMSQESLFLSMAAVPPSGDFMRIPAEVEANGRLCGLLEMLVTIAAPASIEIVPDRSGPEPRIRAEVSDLKATPLEGVLTVTADSVSEFSIGPIGPGRSAGVLVSPGADAPPDTVYSVTARLVLDTGAVVEETRRISFMTCPRAKGPVVLDGKLDEWADAMPIRLDREEQILVGADTWKGPDDCSALIYTMWDDDYFYIAAQVRDDVRSAGVWGEKMNYNDGIEFYLDTDLLGDRHERKYSADDFQYGCFNTPKGPVVWSWQPHGGPSPGGEIAFVYDESLGAGGYVIEARIPLSEFGLTPVPGMTIGFTVALDDDDHPGHYNPFQQERHMIWAGTRETWLDPTQHAQITFIE